MARSPPARRSWSTVSWKTTSAGTETAINLTTGPDCEGSKLDGIALHFNPRHSQKEVVMNSLINNSWGREEKVPMDHLWNHQGPIQVTFVVTPEEFKVWFVFVLIVFIVSFL